MTTSPYRASARVNLRRQGSTLSYFCKNLRLAAFASATPWLNYPITAL